MKFEASLFRKRILQETQIRAVGYVKDMLMADLLWTRRLYSIFEV